MALKVVEISCTCRRNGIRFAVNHSRGHWNGLGDAAAIVNPTNNHPSWFFYGVPINGLRSGPPHFEDDLPHRTHQAFIDLWFASDDIHLLYHESVEPIIAEFLHLMLSSQYLLHLYYSRVVYVQKRDLRNHRELRCREVR